MARPGVISNRCFFPVTNPWSDRWPAVVSVIPPDQSVIDFGCGSREFLQHYQPRDYLGIDRVPPADLVADIDQPLAVSGHWDWGLVLGTLEYVEDPDTVLSNISGLADHFVILALPVARKNTWRRAFTVDGLLGLLHRHFANIEHFFYKRYIICRCDSTRKSS